MNHMALARAPAVYEYVRAWCAGQVAPAVAGGLQASQPGQEDAS